MPPVQWCRIYLLSKYFFGIIILKKNRNVYAKIYYKLPSQILIFWYLWQIGLTNICLIETLDKYLILRYDENCGSCFAAEQFVDIKCFPFVQFLTGCTFVKTDSSSSRMVLLSDFRKINLQIIVYMCFYSIWKRIFSCHIMFCKSFCMDVRW